MAKGDNSGIYKELQPGTGLCGGKYVIENKIGEGGFGITYRAVQTGLNRTVCIKEYFIAGGCVRDTYAKTIHLQGIDETKFERYRKAFVKEAQTLASLHHQGIVEVIDIFDENNTSYMVMPFIEGRSLQSIVEKNGPLSYPEAVNYIAQVANAVGYIHDRHILHRDIKPDNIMITADYKAVLIDFGSAREFEEDKTQAHTSMLTHGYAPAEQYTRSSRKGAYTDVYALGATLYFVLTGRVPIEAAARITEAMPEPKELNPELPDEANRTIMKAMQLNPKDRHQSMGEFMDDLRNVKPSRPVELAAEGGSATAELADELPNGSHPVDKNSGPSKKTEKRDGKGETSAIKAPQQSEVKAIETVGSSKAVKKGMSKGVKMAAVAVAAIVIGIVSWFVIFGNGSRNTEQAEVEYSEAVVRCRSLIDDGSIANTQALIEAKSLLDSIIRPMDSCYGKTKPGVFKHSSDIQDQLAPKLLRASEVCASQADKAMEKRNYRQAVKYYEESLAMVEDESVREGYNIARRKWREQFKTGDSEKADDKKDVHKDEDARAVQLEVANNKNEAPQEDRANSAKTVSASNGIATQGDWVDLGLPSGLLWASRNVGAISPEGYGRLYAWGETKAKDVYDWSTYRYGNDYDSISKYCAKPEYGLNRYTDKLTVLQAADDAATASMGGGARTPMKREWTELFQNTKQMWTKVHGVYGLLFIGTNGNSIFLPAAGSSEGGIGVRGGYWSSSLISEAPYYASRISFGADKWSIGSENREHGFSVRAVKKK